MHHAAHPACAAGLILLAGCASTGPPRPPSLHLPQAVHDLAAQRSGNHVDLSFTVPTLSSDRLPLAGRHGAGPLTAVLCRNDGPSGTCIPVRAFAVSAGESAHQRDDLPPALLGGPPRPLRYTVRLLNAQGRASADSREAPSAAGAAPPPLRNLAAATTAQGVQLTWTAEKNWTAGSPAGTILLQAESAGTERNLKVAGGSAGAIDPAPHVGDVVTYTVVRSIALPGNPPVTLAGDGATVTVRRAPDTFPPAVPTGLASVAVQLAGAPPEIDLSWEPDSEPDLAGYLVERSEGTAGHYGPTILLTPVPLAAVSFRDLQVQPGHTYRYTVRAQDRAGNRSAPGTPAFEELRP